MSDADIIVSVKCRTCHKILEGESPADDHCRAALDRQVAYAVRQHATECSGECEVTYLER